MNIDLGNLIKQFESDSGPKAKKDGIIRIVSGIVLFVIALALAPSLDRSNEAVAIILALLAVFGTIAGIVELVLFSQKAQLEIREKGIRVEYLQKSFSAVYEDMQTPEISTTSRRTMICFKNVYNVSLGFPAENAEAASEICRFIEQIRTERMSEK